MLAAPRTFPQSHWVGCPAVPCCELAIFCWSTGIASRLNLLLLSMQRDPELLRQAVTQPEEVADVDEECVLLARYGYGTWGHWLGEILPIASIVEHRYPRRFRYAVPRLQSAYGCVVKESLRAYGIDAGRLIVLPRGKSVRLANAWAVTPIWSDHTPHPAALDVMRGGVRLSAYRPGYEKIALMRRDWPTRGILNGEEIERFFEARGFRITDAGGMPFVEQVRMFQSASVVFGVIGSGLTGLIYSPNGVRVIGAGPALWGDRFFVALGQHRAAAWAEVRGPSQWDGKTGHLRDALFSIPMAALADSMGALSV